MNDDYTLVYSGNNFGYTVSTADGLTTGVTYRFILKAVNSYGDSIQSKETRVALGNLPPAPAAPFKIEAASSNSSITIAWTAVTSTDDVPIIGYQVYMDDGQNGNF